ncbi:hypothetical protein B0A49_07499 [Cryomyces minteri]|uniref:Rhomboid family membrane protein n=1 Tax=Cryomyces minteri TaxID=331657 RepID=A0A4U0X2J3_9PEZI|nr:hypothetical protein B0A49_07499 [Cryomyces minteri]
MSAPQPPTRPPTTAETEQFRSLTHNLSLGLLFLCPAIALLPPRKVDFYTFGLGTAWLVSANHLTRERSGRSILQHFHHATSQDGGSLPTEKARELQRRLKEERLLRAQPSGQGSERGDVDQVDKEGKSLGIVERVWMGSEKEGWKERRLREEQEALDEGRGYGGLIMDQIYEVWNWKKRDADDEEEQEKK